MFTSQKNDVIISILNQTTDENIMNCFITTETEKYNAENEVQDFEHFELNLTQMKDLIENLSFDGKHHILENAAEFIIVNNKDEGDLSKIKSLILKTPSNKETYLSEYVDNCNDEEFAKMILNAFYHKSIANKLVVELEDEINSFYL